MTTAPQAARPGRRLRKGLSALACVTALTITADPCRGQLRPEEVVVVANEQADGSVALGRYYCAARNILPERMLVVRTTPGMLVDRHDYDINIAAPLRKFLKDNKIDGKIRCIVLMWGVPLRVLGTEQTDEQIRLQNVHREIGQRLHGRMATNLKLLGTVGETFPTPRTNGLRPAGMLFAPDAASVIQDTSSFGKLLKLFGDEVERRESAAAAIEDPAKRALALRQVLALRLDVLGPRDAIKHFPADLDLPVTKADLRAEIQSAEAALAKVLAGAATEDASREAVETVTLLRGVAGAHNFCQDRVKLLDSSGEDASVDSELALLWEKGYKLDGPLPNPMCWRLGASTTKPADLPSRVLMTARIDGPVPRDGLRIIKDSIAVETTGLQGRFYVDAGGKHPAYDVHLRNAAKLVEATEVPVVLNTAEDLFGPGSCPGAALYVGWYSLRKYVPAFEWSRGSVGWHVASFEAQHLRAADNDEWCVKMIQNGVAATLGAVNEPFLAAFPLPEDFFALLLTGRYTVAECYWRCVPHASWRLTLIADPLYNPYKLHPKLSVYQLPPELTGREPLEAPK